MDSGSGGRNADKERLRRDLSSRRASSKACADQTGPPNSSERLPTASAGKPTRISRKPNLSEGPNLLWLKIAVLVLIVILVLLGVAFLADGILLSIFLNGPGQIVLDFYKFAIVNRIAIAVSIFIAAIIGCCGLCYESVCPLCLFFLFSLSLCCTGLSVPWLEHMNLEQADNYSEVHLLDQMRNYWNSLDPTSNDGWDSLQNQLACCGFNASTDWTPYGEVPKSCGGAPRERPGCFEKLLAQMHILRDVARVAYGCLVFFEFIVLFPSSRLANRLRDR